MQNEKYLELDVLAAPNGYVGSGIRCPLPQDLPTVSDRLCKSRSGRTQLRDSHGGENIFAEACLIL